MFKKISLLFIILSSTHTILPMQNSSEKACVIAMPTELGKLEKINLRKNK